MKKKVIVALAVVAVLAVAAVVAIKVFPREAGEPSVKTSGAKAERPKSAIPDKGVVKSRNAGSRRRRVNGTNDVSKVKRKRIRLRVEDNYSPRERRIADGLQAASDDNDLDKVRKTVADIMSEKNPELKKEAISALGYFGRKSIKDLMAFLSDSSQEVVDSATDTIAQALDDMDDEENESKAEFIGTILSIRGLCGKDVVERFAGQLESLGASSERLSVQTMVNLIEDNNVEEVVRARMKEAYEYITSEEYTTFEAAEKWYQQKAKEEEDEAAETEASSKPDDDSDSNDDVKDDSEDNDSEDNDSTDNEQEGTQT